MNGTEKQIEWAQAIKAGLIERWQKGLTAMAFVPSRHRKNPEFMARHEAKLARQRAILATAEEQQAATFWIDNRTRHIDEIAGLLVGDRVR